jgi:hypothetical protein
LNKLAHPFVNVPVERLFGSFAVDCKIEDSITPVDQGHL